MLNGLPILVAEDEPFVAMDLVQAIEDVGGCVVGPVATVAQAMTLLSSEAVEGAIIDANLADRDATPLVLALMDRSVPFVIYTGSDAPPQLAALRAELLIVTKPARSTRVLAALLQSVSPDRARFEN